MRKRIVWLAWLAWVPATVSMADDAAPELPRATPSAVGLSAGALAEIGPWMEERVESGQVPGMVTMAARNGKVVHQASAGTLDMETDTRVREDSIFRIYSMTKPIVSAGLMVLYDEGRFELTDPVAQYLPELTDMTVWTEDGEVPATRPMTIADLLRHTAGFTYGFFGSTAVDKLYQARNVLGQNDLDAMIDVLGGLPLLFHPGERWHYSVAVENLVGIMLIQVRGNRAPLIQEFAGHVYDALEDR